MKRADLRMPILNPYENDEIDVMNTVFDKFIGNCLDAVCDCEVRNKIFQKCKNSEIMFNKTYCNILDVVGLPTDNYTGHGPILNLPFIGNKSNYMEDDTSYIKGESDVIVFMIISVVYLIYMFSFLLTFGYIKNVYIKIISCIIFLLFTSFYCYFVIFSHFLQYLN